VKPEPSALKPPSWPPNEQTPTEEPLWQHHGLPHAEQPELERLLQEELQRPD
jgi:hypothetical protein